MTSYFSTFVPGLEEVVEAALGKDLRGYQRGKLFDGIVIYKAECSWTEVKDLRYLNNSYILLAEFERVLDRVPMEHLAKSLLKTNWINVTKKGKSFRIMGSVENVPTAIPRDLLSKLEEKVRNATGMRVDRTSPDQEFLILYRREGIGLFGLRITKHPDYKKVLMKGQLRPELADLLCQISDMDKEEVVLDPFAGSGAIGIARKTYVHKKIILGDIEPTSRGIERMDALKMKSVDSDSVDKIITDPPWGVSVGLSLDLPDFYRKLLQEFSRVLKTSGLVLILIGKKEIFEEQLIDFRSVFEQIKKYDVLVSGKKAAVYKLRKVGKVLNS